MNELKVGLPAPDFSLPTTDGSMIRLSQYRGKKVVLYFYPKDNTPACSKQAQAFAAAFDQIGRLGAVILGVSRDPIASHAKFTAKLGLPFQLLSDAHEEICRLYKVMKEKNMYGKTVMGIERSTFIINEQGVLTHEFRKVKVSDHLEQVLEVLKPMDNVIH